MPNKNNQVKLVGVVCDSLAKTSNKDKDFHFAVHQVAVDSVIPTAKPTRFKVVHFDGQGKTFKNDSRVEVVGELRLGSYTNAKGEKRFDYYISADTITIIK